MGTKSPAGRGRALAFALAAVGAALYFVLIEVHRASIPAQDVYAYFLPNAVHAARSFWESGRGLLWNPFQSCGQPFLANTEVGLLYPSHLLFLVLEPNVAVHVVLIITMTVGAIGMFLLARELALAPVAAVGAALVFELGDPMGQLVSWSPMHSGPWAWVPWSLLFTERLLQRPNGRDLVGLAITLGLQLLAGFVLIAVLTYQLLGLRILWDVLLRGRRAVPGAATVVIGLVCGALLVAVQIFPAAELVALSTRISGAVVTNPMDLAAILSRTAKRGPPLPFMAGPLLLAPLVLMTPSHRRIAAFYLIAGALFGLLALGSETPLFEWYTHAPFVGATVRNHVRLFWITGFCLATLTGIAIDELARGSARHVWMPAGLVVLGAILLGSYAPGGLRWTETVSVGAIVVGVVVAILPAMRPWIAWMVLGATVFNVAAVPLRWPGSLLPSVPLVDFAPNFAEIFPPVSSRDRVLLEPTVGQTLQARFVQKTSTMLRIAGFQDYEPLLTQRFEKYWGQLLKTSGAEKRPLVDLASLRVLAASPGARIIPRFGLPRYPTQRRSLQISLNSNAFARARYVPAVEVIADPDALLSRIGSGQDDLATIAFVEERPASGFLGTPTAPPAGFAQFALDDPEHVVIDVEAPERGFLLLADQYFPGWRAHVNGVYVPILRADYLFRLVEVPQGVSRVEFIYWPMSVLLGAAVSAVMLCFLGVVLLQTWRTPQLAT